MLSHRFSDRVIPSRVVVLGATGFVANAIVRLFRGEGIECRPVSAREIDLAESSAAGKLQSILRAEDSIVVTSALTPEKGRDRATFHKNVRMIESLCAVIEEVGFAHIVYISSDSVYDSRCACVNEESCCETGDMYGLSHLVREKLLIDACRAYPARLAILRPGALYGAGDTHNSYGPNRFVRSALATGKIALFGEGEEERDHIYIGDVARIIQLCLLHRSSGILNAVSGETLSFREVAETVAAAVDRDVALEMLPRRMPIVHRCFDASALRDAFPDFRTTRLEAGIREMISEISNGAERDRSAASEP